ncbi:MAG: transglutaminase domain-containing protein [Lachnospiraceae bacterium]|nr:transglutaminase domain-containing protein [Lachnospiraceae bacterium]
MISEYLKRYAEERFRQRLPFLEAVREEILQGLKGCGEKEQVLMKFLYGTMPVRDAGEYPFSVFLSYVTHSLMVYQTMEWCRDLPEDLFLHYVLYYRVNTEAIEDCRRFFYDQLYGRIQGLSAREAVLEINYWAREIGTYETTDDRTMSPLTFYRCGKGRCGEESTFAVTAFRSVGIPARQVYVPWWAHCDDNHAWVEVYVNRNWYFLGACEPEEALNKGWFANAAARAVMVHSPRFSDYPKKDGEGFLKEEDMLVYDNRTSDYGETKEYEIQVVDENHLPIKQACLQIELLNMAEYNRIATVYSDQEGKAKVVLGLGDIRIQGKKDGCYGAAFGSVGREDGVCLKLTKLPVWGALNRWIDVDFEAPADGPVNKAVLTKQQKEKNRLRLKACGRLNDKRIREYYKEAIARQYPDQEEILQKAAGNFHEIIKFLTKDENPDRKRLLSCLADKDYKDVKAEVLEQHLAMSSPFRKQWESKGELERYVQDILNPRIYLEELQDYKTFIWNFFDFGREQGQRLKEIYCENPKAIWDHIKRRTQFDPKLDYQSVCSTPKCCLKMAWGSVLSQKILFVAVCRTLGIPARINPVNKEAEFYRKGSFHPVSQSEKELVKASQEMEFGQAVLLSEEGIRWNYYQTWTIGRLLGQEVETLNYSGIKFQDGRLTLTLEPGYYRIITANRLPNGNQQASEYWFCLEKGQVKEIPMRLREGKPEDMLTANKLEDFEVIYGNRRVSAASLTEGKPAVFAFLSEGQEPTEHVLNEILEQADAFRQIPARIFFVLQEPEALENKTIRKVLRTISKIQVLYGKFDEIVETVARRMYVDPDRLPLLLLTNPGLNGIYGCSGYHVGSVGLMMKLLEISRNQKEDKKHKKEYK